MKKIIIGLISIIAILIVWVSINSSIQKDFSISLTWGIGGESYYNSETGVLRKTDNATTPKDYITTLFLSDDQKNQLYKMILEMDIESYPEEYDPFNDPNAEKKIGGSKPPRRLVLHIKTANIEKTIECCYAENFRRIKGYNEEAQAFLDLCELLYEMIISSEEWKALPEYEFFYLYIDKNIIYHYNNFNA